MKYCPSCGAQADDSAVFCPNCGAQFSSAGQQTYYAPPQSQHAPMVDPYDHTAEFDAQDISENKLFAMLVYLMDIVGVIIALLAAGSSKYVAFHIRQALKFTVVELLTGIAIALLCWTILVPIAGGIFMIVLFVIKIICFFQVCKGEAREPAIIRSLGFLR